MPSNSLAIANRLIDTFSPRQESIAVDYEDCFFHEPINWLYPARQADGAWREETWALELFFKGQGQRGGALFHAIETDPSHDAEEKAQRLKRLDQIALLSLRRAVLQRLLEEYPGLIYSINVTAVTLADSSWFQNYIDGFIQELRRHNAQDRVVLEIQEHPQEILKALNLDQNALSRRLELLRHSPIRFAIDDAYSPNYVFQMVSDSLDGRIVWQKMDWQYFQKMADDSRPTLHSGIRKILAKKGVQLIIEGVKTETLKGFLCEDVLKGGRLPTPRRVAIQSINTHLILPARPSQDAAPPKAAGRRKMAAAKSAQPKHTKSNRDPELELPKVPFLEIVPLTLRQPQSIDPIDRALIEIIDKLTNFWQAVDYCEISKAQEAALKQLVIAGLIEQRLLVKSEMEEFNERISLICRVCGNYKDSLVEKIFTFMPHWRNDQNKTAGHWMREIHRIVHARLTIEGERAKQDIPSLWTSSPYSGQLNMIPLLKLLNIPGSVEIEAKHIAKRKTKSCKSQPRGKGKMNSEDAFDVWGQRKDFLESELAKASGASQRFSIKKEIEDCEQNLRRLNRP